MKESSPITPISRRESLKKLATGGAALSLLGSAPLSAMQSAPFAKSKEVHVFSKHLQWLDYDGMAKTAAKIGFDGIDLTVRPKGHVLPEQVETDLPRAVQAIRKAGLNATMMTTSVWDTKDPLTEKILKTAGSLGIKYYRMAYLPYKPEYGIAENLERYKPGMKELEEMNKHYGLHGAYQNHAGTKIGGVIWDIWELIKDLDPQWMGCQFDIRHATVEGGVSWPVSLKLLQSYIKTMDIKDFVWAKTDGKWKPQNVPLGEGMVDFSAYFKLVRELAIDSIYSLHYEYELGGADHGKTEITITPKELMDAMKKDLAFLRDL